MNGFGIRSSALVEITLLVAVKRTGLTYLDFAILRPLICAVIRLRRLRSTSPPGAFGERVECSEYFRRPPHPVAGPARRLDKDSHVGEWVEVTVRIGRLDAQLLRQ